MKEMDDINGEFSYTDVAIVIGANDVTNPAARNDPSSPIHGMLILNVDEACSVIVLKRGMSVTRVSRTCCSSVNAPMLLGDAKKSVDSVIDELKAL